MENADGSKVMNLEGQIKAFRLDLEALCERYANEFELPIEAAVGVLQCAIIQAYLNSQK